LLLFFGIGRLVFALSDASQWALLAAAVLLAIAVTGALGNAWLYAACTRRIDAALAATSSTEEACAQLALRASGRKRQAALAAGNLALLAVIVGLALVWPRGGSVPLESAQLSTARASESATPELGVSGLAAQSVAHAALETASAPASPAAPTPASASASATSAASAPVPITAPAPAASAPATRISQGLVQAAVTTSLAASSPQATASATARAASAPVAKPLAEAAKKSTRNEPASPASDGTFLVNVGLFADADNARKASAKLKVAGLPVLRQMVKTPKGASRTRVRVGPFNSRAEAETAAETIRALQLDAAIVKN
jgi:cell division protein FtsN